MMMSEKDWFRESSYKKAKDQVLHFAVIVYFGLNLYSQYDNLQMELGVVMHAF